MEESQIKVTSAANDNEANIIISMLDNYGIKAFPRRSGIGDYMHIYTGISMSGIDIYVDKDAKEDALKILESESAIGENDFEENEYNGNASDNNKIDSKYSFYKGYVRFLAGIIFLTATGALCVAIFKIVKYLFRYFV